MANKLQKEEENVIPGSILTKPFEAATVPELKRWLKCRNASTSGLKADLVERCKTYTADPSRLHNIVDPDRKNVPSTKIVQSSHPDKENLNAGEWTRSLDGLSECFGEGKIYEHLGGKAEKHRIAGYNMFKCNKVENMLVKYPSVNNVFDLKGIVGASYSKDRYKVSVKINTTGKVVEAHCSCKAGAMGLCKHVAALLFNLNDHKQSGKNIIEEQLACTEKPREWGVKHSRKPLVPKKFEDLTFVKFAPDKSEKNVKNSQQRREYSSLPAKRQALSPRRLKELAINLSSTRCMWSDLIFEEFLTFHWHCDVQSSCSDTNSDVMQLANLPTESKAFTNCIQDFNALINNGLLEYQDINLESEVFQEKLRQTVNDLPPLTEEEINIIEKETRGQSSNEKWFYHRRDRITASMVGEIMHQRITTPPDAIVSRICYSTFKNRNIPNSCLHGIRLESEARQEYTNICHSNGYKVVVEERGLVVDRTHSWLGASVDGIVKVSHPIEDIGIIEIKCPYIIDKEDGKAKSNVPQNLIELCLARKNFYLIVDESNNITGLNKKHNYYFQVQTQLGVLGIKWCDFMVYYKVEHLNICSSFISRVQFDSELYEKHIIPKLYSFYLKGVVPEIITRRIKKGHKLYPNSKNYIYSH